MDNIIRDVVDLCKARINSSAIEMDKYHQIVEVLGKASVPLHPKLKQNYALAEGDYKAARDIINVIQDNVCSHNMEYEADGHNETHYKCINCDYRNSY